MTEVNGIRRTYGLEQTLGDRLTDNGGFGAGMKSKHGSFQRFAWNFFGSDVINVFFK
jgi:hypothetical protein